MVVGLGVEHKRNTRVRRSDLDAYIRRHYET